MGMRGEMQRSISFSKTFDIVKNKEIGLYEAASDVYLKCDQALKL